MRGQLAMEWIQFHRFCCAVELPHLASHRKIAAAFMEAHRDVETRAHFGCVSCCVFGFTQSRRKMTVLFLPNIAYSFHEFELALLFTARGLRQRILSNKNLKIEDDQHDADTASLQLLFILLWKGIAGLRRSVANVRRPMYFVLLCFGSVFQCFMQTTCVCTC